MENSPNPLRRFLTWLAVATAAFVVGATVYDYVLRDDDLGGLEYRLGSQRLEDGLPGEALAQFDALLAEHPDHVPGRLGRALALMGLGRDEAALAAFAETLALDPDFAAVYANRGILLDRLGRHREALADYRRALELNPELGEGPDWLTRFFRNQPDRPPTIADRARYLEAELEKPADERVLRVPEVDARQRSYKYEKILEEDDPRAG